MIFTVVWLPSALNELAALWLAAADRVAVTASSHRIDARLATDPFAAGESRESDMERIVFDPPLQVMAHVFQDESLVWVTAVAPFGRP